MRASLWGVMLMLAVLTLSGPARTQGFGPLPGEQVERRALPPLGGGQGEPQAPGAPPPLSPFETGQPQSGVPEPLPQGVWQGVRADELTALLQKMPQPLPSSALQEALGQVLAAPDNGEAGLAASRLSALYQAGLIDAAIRSGEALSSAGDPVAQAIYARALLARGERQAACRQVSGLPLGHEAGDSLLRTASVLQLVCDLAAGNRQAALLGVNLARDRGLEAAFPFAVADQIAGGSTPKLPSLPKAMAVEDYALMTFAKLPISGEVVARAAPALLVHVVGDAQAPALVRLAAAEEGAKLNIVPGRQLAEAYLAPRFASSEIPKLLNSPQAGARHRALLFQAMSAANEPQEKMKLLGALAASAEKARLQVAMAQAVQSELAAIAPAPALNPAADMAIRLAALSGDAQTVQGWLSLAESQAATRALAGRWRIVLDIVGLSGPGGSEAAMQAATELALSGDLSPELQHKLVTVLDALGYNVPIPLWESASRTPQPSGGFLPETGHLSRLSEAEKRGQAGVAVLLALQALGPDGPAGANLIALGDAVRALQAAGLEQAARGAAFEALYPLLPDRGSHG